MRYLKVRNLERYQHYTKRNPPWVKLHQEIMEDYDFAALPDASKAHALLLILLASRTNNRIPADPLWVAQKINARSPVDLEALMAAGFIDDASNLLDNCPQDAIAEREGEQSRERAEREKSASKLTAITLKAGFDEAFEVWSSTLGEHRARVRPTGPRRDKYDARRREGYSQEQILAALRNYVNDPWPERTKDDRARDMTTLLRDGGQVEKFAAMTHASTRTSGRRPTGHGEAWSRDAAEALKRKSSEPFVNDAT